MNLNFLRCGMDRPLRYVTGRENPYITFSWVEVVPAQALPGMYELEAASSKTNLHNTWELSAFVLG